MEAEPGPSPVPVIDLAAATRPDAAAAVLDQVRHATETVGVLQVVNHGVPLDLISQFDQRIGRLLSRPRVGAAGPEDDPELRDLTFRYTAAGQSLAERVLGLYARAQGLPEATFPVDPLPYLSLAAPGAGWDGDELLPGHPDGPVLTVLARDGGYQGLQVRLPDGGWRPVPAVPGALLVLSGRLLARWTNGRLRPARPRAEAGGAATRRSAAVFYYQALGRGPAPLAPFARPGLVKVPGRPPRVTAWRGDKELVLG